MKYYTCLSCKDIVPCIPNNYENCEKIKEFLRKHGTHMVVLLTKKQLKEFSYKRFHEFHYKLQRGMLNVQNCG